MKKLLLFGASIVVMSTGVASEQDRQERSEKATHKVVQGLCEIADIALEESHEDSEEYLDKVKREAIKDLHEEKAKEKRTFFEEYEKNKENFDKTQQDKLRVLEQQSDARCEQKKKEYLATCEKEAQKRRIEYEKEKKKTHVPQITKSYVWNIGDYAVVKVGVVFGLLGLGGFFHKLYHDHYYECKEK